MSTATCSAEPGTPRRAGSELADEAWRAVCDVRHLLWFRRATVRHRGATRMGGLLVLLLTAAAALVPRWAPGAGGSGTAFDLLVLLPSALGGFLLLATLSQAVSGGGRELLARDPGSVYPLSPTTDHLGALLLAPLNVAWLVQLWTLLGVTSYGLGDQTHWGAAQVVVLLWAAAATAFAQVVAWCLEGLRRLRHGVVVLRATALVVGAAGVGVVTSGNLGALLDAIPTRWLVAGLMTGYSGSWALTLLGLVALAAGLVVVGAVPAHLAARRLPRDEAGIETRRFGARSAPRSAMAAFVRLDRASVWRAVPMRRGLVVLAVGPGLIALLGDLEWNQLIVLPGLVASGGALLFGVNVWCLDGRGTLWRESLPASPTTAFLARSLVLAEFLLLAAAATVALGSLRAGAPEPAALAALVCAMLVVTAQVVAGAMRWSVQHPYAVDLRSARAAPAPPSSMVGYSARLALTTTLTGLVFSGLARLPEWPIVVLLAVPFLCWSLFRLTRVHRRWLEPATRARVVVTVAS